jgi:radical SAM superfamily enzyme YgiQ (UPF0313 family)
MKILFIYPDIGASRLNFCPAIHILSAVLKRIDCEVDLIHVNNEYGVEYDKGTILSLSEGYDLYAFTATSFNYKYANEIAGWLKIYNKLLILGGCHATIEPEDFEDSNFDIFCVGEGEEPFVDFIRALRNGTDWNSIPGFITRLRHNPPRGYVKDLNKLPFCDYDITDTEKILMLKNGWFSLSFSRGCPFACTFCINHLYKKIGSKSGDKISYVRKRTPEKAVDEMVTLVKKYKIDTFNLDDDLLTMDAEWMKEFAELYTEKIYDPFGVKYAINSRASYLNEDMVKLLAFSGCREVRIGFETGNEKLRNKILNKTITNEELINACNLLNKYGINSDLFAMMGIPGETHDTFQDTVDMVIKMKPKLIRMNFLFPYKHTKIYDLCVKENLFKKDFDVDNDRTESPLVFVGLTNRDIFCFRFMFPWYVNAKSGIKEYKEAIEYFKYLPFEQIREMISFIVKMDEKLSKECTVPHYKYMAENTNYFIYDTRERLLA